MVKEIPLTNGAVAIVDDDDYERLSQWKWHLHPQGYAVRTEAACSYRPKKKTILMHKDIIMVKKGYYVDHIDRNKLNNIKTNLREVTAQQNCINCGPRKRNSSGVKGVIWDKSRSKWQARIQVSRRTIHLGRYNARDDADTAYQLAVKKYFPGMVK